MNGNRNAIKQMEPTMQKIGGNSFYIYPFSAFTSANMSGEITALLTPLIASIVPAIGTSRDKNVMDMDVGEVAPHIAGAFSALSGDKVESLLRKLLLNGNVGVLPAGSADAQWLTEELANEVFCGNTQDMFVLAFYVIKVNYVGFFEKLRNLSGNANMQEAMMKMGFPGMAPLT